MTSLKIILALTVFLIAIPGFSQQQLILRKGEKVVWRLKEGDDFVFSLKKSKELIKGFAIAINDTAVVMEGRIIPIRRIDRIYFKRHSFINKAGSTLVFAGILLFGIDLLNRTVVQGGDGGIDKGVAVTSIALIGAGLPMALIKKKSERPGFRYRLMVVNTSSVFYGY
jgi:hypothetical protein